MHRRAIAGLAATVLLAAVSAPASAAEPGNIKGKARSFLFVQNARHGTFTALKGRPGHYRLSLRDVDPSVLYFTDRPARDTWLLSQKALLGSLYAKGQAAPNAAIEIVGGAKDQDVLAVKLSNPRSDERRRTLSYEATRLPNVSAPGLRHYRSRLDRKLPARFNAVSLFIDSGIAWGNTCQENVANSTSETLLFSSEDKWSTDTWQVNLAGVGIPSDGKLYDAGYTTGGFARGCHNSTVWTLDDGTVVTFSSTDPYSKSNSFSCVTSDPMKYQCTLQASSVIHGPILYLNWTLDNT